MRIIKENSIDSTNNFVSQKCRDIEPPFIVMTDFQSGGKGQGNNQWESENGKNLLFSIVIEPKHLDVSRNFFISKITALSLFELVKSYISDVQIKWPNDILAGGRKISGILIENSLNGSRVFQSTVGIGLNVNQVEFPEMEIVPTSLKLITKTNFDREKLLNEFIEIFFEHMEYMDRREFDAIDKDYFSKLLNYDNWAEYQHENQVFKGKIVDVMDEGYLILETEDGNFQKFGFGEIKQLGISPIV